MIPREILRCFNLFLSNKNGFEYCEKSAEAKVAIYLAHYSTLKNQSLIRTVSRSLN